MGIIKNLRIACLMTITTAIILGVLYPLVVTGLAQVFFPWRTESCSSERVASLVRISSDNRFLLTAIFILAHLALELGYDASSSGSHQLAPTTHQLIGRVNDVERLRTENSLTPVPIDLVTESASGLGPDISPAASEFQIPRVARARGIDPERLRSLISENTENRQFAFLGERRVNVLEVNLALDRLSK